MTDTSKVAFITGGASGMGLAVAQALANRGNWTLHLVDLNETAGQKAASDLPNAHFHKTNVTSYASLSSAFDNAFKASGRFDFIYANAGIVERDNFYAVIEGDGVPPEPIQLSIDINLKAVVNTSYLALHYLRKSPHQGKDAALVMTASCGGLYPSEFCPMYSAAKAGVIHFNRSIAFSYHTNDGIRTYATAPGTIATGLLSSKEWEVFPKKYFTPIETLVKAVLVLIDGGDMTDSKGKHIPADKAWGLTVEVNIDNYYFRDAVPFGDPDMEAMMKYTSMETQIARIEEGKRNGA